MTTLRPLLTGRIGQPDDVARSRLPHLPSVEPVTGAEWVVDGGALPQDSTLRDVVCGCSRAYPTTVAERGRGATPAPVAPPRTLQREATSPDE